MNDDRSGCASRFAFPGVFDAVLRPRLRPQAGGADLVLRGHADPVGSVLDPSQGIVNIADQRRFVRTKRTRVAGQRASWTELRAGDSVIVTWSLDDDPVECRRIDVLSTSGSR